VLSGAGAAGTAIVRLLQASGARHPPGPGPAGGDPPAAGRAGPAAGTRRRAARRAAGPETAPPRRPRA